ncbi:hypothetical protein [Streptomyces neyagawaensis]|uniref:hypothetical protein n=2 Tax=Streptomyces neyagawaensis TaxID=42238 RepID=UPI00201CF568|nr:hypothetical protein [Streptomyces neyagawaensis]MCL6734484.1 hypothetical protein [Streptomyces neyagawaensis]MDE1685598.1 hypothetical protein [Streptomyces neyagawaensis]
MSSLSRRTLLGYTGTAAAGTAAAGPALFAGGPARAAENGSADENPTPVQAQAQAQENATADFPEGTKFSGYVRMPGTEMTELTVSFTVSTTEAPAAQRISALEVANALNELAATRGWPPITFYGTPAPAPLN